MRGEWSDKEAAYIAANYGKMPVAEIARNLSKTRVSIYRYASRHGLAKAHAKPKAKRMKPPPEKVPELTDSEKNLIKMVLPIIARAKAYALQTGKRADISLPRLKELCGSIKCKNG